MFSKLFKNMIFIGYSLVVGLLLVEIILWLFFPVPASYEVKRTLRNVIPGLKQQYIYSRDADGFRSLSMRTIQKPSDTIRILCLGASTTDQGVQSIEDTWSGILEQKLNREFAPYGRHVEVAARGFGGNSATDVFLWAEENALRYQPDIVVFLLGINDLCWHGGPEYSYSTIQDRLKQKKTTRRHISSWQGIARGYSQIVRRFIIIRSKYELQKMITGGRALEWHSRNLDKLRIQYRNYPFADQLVRNPDPIIEFQDAMRELLKYFGKVDTQVVVMSQPTLWKSDMEGDALASMWFYVNTPQGPLRPSTAWLEKEMIRYNKAQENLAKEYGAAYIGLDQKIPKERSYMFDDCHFTDLGSRKVAEEAFGVLRQKVEGILAS